jgi:hypothetical protein
LVAKKLEKELTLPRGVARVGKRWMKGSPKGHLEPAPNLEKAI